MCGIAGVIHKGSSANIGLQMTSMLHALKHRGPDSAGFALFGSAGQENFIIRFKVAERDDLQSGFEIHSKIEERKAEVQARLQELGADIGTMEQATEYAFRFVFSYSGDMRKLADYVEDIDGVEILSLGNSLELIKDLGGAREVATEYSLDSFQGTHAIGHTRMATESDVDIRSAHPYWAYPYNDIAVVHNGQLTNYWSSRRVLEYKGHRFKSDCDSELIAVYIADKLEQGISLKEAMCSSVEELDGVFTYLVATRDSLGMAKDTMAAKPVVLYESDDFIAMASEEVAIRSIFPHEIDTTDPFEGEVRVWHN